MSTTLTETPATTAAHRREPAAVRPIGFARLVAVELRKTFDTRSGLWLLISVAVLSLLASAAVLLFMPDTDIDYESFGSALGVPMSVLLPVMAILSVTSEWSQRTGLTTFTLVPHRGKVIAAKAVGTAITGVAAIAVALSIGALGNLAGSAINGTETIWNVSVHEILGFTLASVLGMFMGFMLGLLFRNSAAAIVGYFVYSFVVPTLSGVLYGLTQWYRDIQEWVDFQSNVYLLYDKPLTSEQWLHLGVSGLLWLIIPLTIGWVLATRKEVK